MDEGERSATNMMVLDSMTLMSILVIAVFVIKVFNRVLQSNRAANLPVAGRRKRDARQYLRSHVHSVLNERQIENFSIAGTSSAAALKINRAALTYDFIFLMIGSAATLLFVLETLFRVYRIYTRTNQGRSVHKRRKRSLTEDPLLCQIIISACHDLSPEIKAIK